VKTPPPTSSRQPLTYAVIGCSASVAPAHVGAIARIPGAHVGGVCGRDDADGVRLAAEAGCPSFPDHGALLSAVKPDVAVVCGPHTSHAAIAIDCLAAGAHVLVEKPIAAEVAEADAMIAAADKAGRLLAVCFPERFRPAVENARAFIAAGGIGSLVRVLCVEPLLRTAAFYRSAPWRGTWKGEGGGVLMNQAARTLDLIAYLVGPPARVSGWTRTRFHSIECEDSAQAMFEYPNGSPGYLSVSTAEWGVPRQIQIVGDQACIELVGEKLVIRRFDPALSAFMSSSRDPKAKPTVQTDEPDLSTAPSPSGPLAVHLDLGEAIRNGREPRCSGRAGRMSLEMANAIVLSSFEKRPVALPVDREAYRALLRELKNGWRAQG
jgi:UDP-N-acetyl-2-amino-2-deoxyglucuronate dehydrogenase